MKSWKTTGSGIGMILAAIGSLFRIFASDAPIDPNTITLSIGGIIGGAGLLVARDDKVTSEDAGAS